MSEQKKIDDGGPVFPCEREEEVPLKNGGSQVVTVSYSGMSLRDYFAAHALTGLCSFEHVRPSHAKAFADRAYALADAMLAARSKTGGEG